MSCKNLHLVCGFMTKLAPWFWLFRAFVIQLILNSSDFYTSPEFEL